MKRRVFPNDSYKKTINVNGKPITWARSKMLILGELMVKHKKQKANAQLLSACYHVDDFGDCSI